MKRVLMLSVMVLFLMSLLTVNGLYAGSQETFVITGKVVETMDSGGYTYALLEKGGKKTWVAMWNG